jgi:molybdopterin converting factor small subunit
MPGSAFDAGEIFAPALLFPDPPLEPAPQVGNTSPMTITGSPTLRVRVLFFASYADRVGREAEDLILSSPATVGDVVRRVRAVLPGGDHIAEHPLAAINQTHARLIDAVADGDEVALLPPLAGG